MNQDKYIRALRWNRVMARDSKQAGTVHARRFHVQRALHYRAMTRASK